MKFPEPQTLQQIAHFLKIDFVGNPDFLITGINEIHLVEKGDIVFVDHPKYYNKALHSAATTILIDKKVDCPERKTLLISKNPFNDFNKIIKYFNPFIASKKSISKTAIIGEQTIIQPNVFIGNHVKIGNHCIIHPNVTIYDNCTIGDNVTIHANTVLGADAFYYKNRTTGYDKFISAGSIIIEDNVDLGASCTIDRGVTGNTIIKEGTKIDNQVHIGHDTVIGKKCLIAGQTGIAGCVVIEDEVTIWGQVGIVSGLTIEKGTVLMAQTGVSKSLKKNTYYGTPAINAQQRLREVILLKNMVNNSKKK